LTAFDEVSVGLGIAEGVEDALAILAGGWSPIWAATSSGAIARFPLLAGVASLAVFADADDAGLNAARACCERWRSSGIEARIIAPKGAYERRI